MADVPHFIPVRCFTALQGTTTEGVFGVMWAAQSSWSIPLSTTLVVEARYPLPKSACQARRRIDARENRFRTREGLHGEGLCGESR